MSNIAKVKDESPRTNVGHRRFPEIHFAILGLILASTFVAVWAVWPQVRRAAIGWRSILDGLSVQRALNADLSADDEFARAAFAEFSRLSPEADVGQLHLHLVR